MRVAAIRWLGRWSGEEATRRVFVQRLETLMHEPLIDDGTIRKLWIGEGELYGEYLLRLDAESRRNRFGGAVSDEFIRKYSEPSTLTDAVIHGFFVDGAMRGATELRPLGSGGDAEAAFGIETGLAEPRRGNGLARTHAARRPQP